ncbi:MAG TPA: FtsQ-type POTRA domain-containing protein [Microbacteriaceae bacterium]|nr:FtsQ-type POTRA domain-containing protein [Microbacteriaceae bacterium]
MKRPKGFVPSTQNEDPAKRSPSEYAETYKTSKQTRVAKLEKINFKSATSKKVAKPQSPDVLNNDESLLKTAKREVKVAKREVRIAKRQRKRRERKEKKRFTAFNRLRRIRVIVAAAAIIGLALFVVVGVVTPVMSVRNIEVQGTNRLSETELKSALEPLIGTPVALVDDTEVVKALKDFKLIEKYTTLLIPPDTLSVMIVERTAALAVPRGEEFELVDAAGVILEVVTSEDKPEGLPTTVGASADINSKEFKASALVALGISPELRLEVESIEAPTPFSVMLTLKSGVNVLWGDATENSYKSLILESIIEALGEQEVTIIDVSSPKSPVFQ